MASDLVGSSFICWSSLVILIHISSPVLHNDEEWQFLQLSRALPGSRCHMVANGKKGTQTKHKSDKHEEITYLTFDSFNENTRSTKGHTHTSMTYITLTSSTLISKRWCLLRLQSIHWDAQCPHVLMGIFAPNSCNIKGNFNHPYRSLANSISSGLNFRWE